MRIFNILLCLLAVSAHADFIDHLAPIEKQQLSVNALQDLSKARNAILSGKDDEAIIHYRSLALKGVVSAQIALSRLYGNYLDGKHIEETLKWSYYAALANDGASQARLAKAYIVGNGLTKSARKAKFWLDKAISNGYIDARTQFKDLLTLSLEEANALQKSTQSAEAEGLILPLAELGFTKAQLWLIRHYQSTQFKTTANGIDGFWLNRVLSESDVVDRLSIIKSFVHQGDPAHDEIIKDFLLNELEKKQADRESLFILSQLLFNNEKSIPLAIEVLRDSGQRGHSEAQFQLGVLYLHGKLVTADQKTAVAWLNKASQQGYTPAYNLLKTVLPYDDQKNITPIEQPPIPEFPILQSIALNKGNENLEADQGTKKRKEKSTSKNHNETAIEERKNNVRFLLGKKWLKDLPKTGYILQFASSLKRDVVEKTRKHVKLSDNCLIYQYDDYFVLSGYYFPSYSQAQKYAEVKTNKKIGVIPIVRNLKVIKGLLLTE